MLQCEQRAGQRKMLQCEQDRESIFSASRTEKAASVRAGQGKQLQCEQDRELCFSASRTES